MCHHHTASVHVECVSLRQCRLCPHNTVPVNTGRQGRETMVNKQHDLCLTRCYLGTAALVATAFLMCVCVCDQPPPCVPAAAAAASPNTAHQHTHSGISSSGAVTQVPVYAQLLINTVHQSFPECIATTYVLSTYTLLLLLLLQCSHNTHKVCIRTAGRQVSSRALQVCVAGATTTQRWPSTAQR